MKNQTRLPGPFRIIRYPLEIGGDWEDEVSLRIRIHYTLRSALVAALAAYIMHLNASDSQNIT